MATGKGFKGVFGLSKSTTWGTPVAVGAGEQLPFNSESITPDVQFIPDEQVSGTALTFFGDKGNEVHQGDISHDFDWGLTQLLTALALAIGTAGAPAQLDVGEAAYQHNLLLLDDLEGLHATLAFNKNTGKVWEYTTAKAAGFTFSNSNNQRLKVALPWIAHALNLNDASGTNNTTTIGNLTLPATSSFARFAQMKVYANAQGGGALGASDRVYTSDMEFTWDNNFPSDDFTTQFGDKVDEPVRDGDPVIGGTLGFSKAHNNAGGNQTLFENMLDKTRMKMLVEWTGPTFTSSYEYKLSVYLPDVQFATGDQNIGGKGRIPQNLEYVCNKVATAPTGFPTGVTHPAVVVVNGQGTDPLA